ncbi:hypothetical protein B0T22DRAFT_497551 [Podospora appendiculata]|uniref:CCD97-like C-terminal domain-containing protein n=1 Tax=Podospora appendiculata TaxID=314037 RepID=A0AAE0XLG6_9PEZI|nr:hypothetical protein B0T22DRAFT_497551 [Podospora appendiculata]
MSPRFDSPPASPAAFSQPRPRPPKSSAHAALVRVRNRRREYLARNPGYFKSSEHELSDPLLYDSLVRQFQSPAEREEEGRQKGYARVLEGSLMRGEERLAQLAAQQDSPHMAAASTPTTREDGLEQWEAFLRERFVRGEDDDFEYPRVDDDDEYDVLERREREEAWFDEEDPEWASSGDGSGSPASKGGGGDPETGVRVERFLEGETGVQDY